MATASLAAIYTDSDDSQDGSVNHIEDKENVHGVEFDKSQEPRRKEIRSLVSYLDETLDSEDEAAEEALERASEVNSLGWSGAREVPWRSTLNGLETEFVSSTASKNILPPEPKGACPVNLQRRVQQFSEKMSQNRTDINEMIQHRKNFRNPSIYEKLVQHCSIDEFGTNYHASLYDPKKWGSESFYENLRGAQDEVMKKRVESSAGGGTRNTTMGNSIAKKT